MADLFVHDWNLESKRHGPLKELKAGWQDYRYEYDVKIVQPGLSRDAVGEEGLHLLAALRPTCLKRGPCL
jgi:hypothetical protein